MADTTSPRSSTSVTGLRTRRGTIRCPPADPRIPAPSAMRRRMKLTETRSKLRRSVLAMVAAAWITGCSSERPLPAKAYFDTGNEAMRGKTYDLAIDQYQKLFEEH